MSCWCSSETEASSSGLLWYLSTGFVGWRLFGSRSMKKLEDTFHITSQQEVCICSWMRGWLTKLMKLANFTALSRKISLMLTSCPAVSMSLHLSTCVFYSVWCSLVDMKKKQLFSMEFVSKIRRIICLSQANNEIQNILKPK